MTLYYKTKNASEVEIALHLKECNKNFCPPLEHRINIGEYAKKLFNQSITFEAWDRRTLIGLIAVYINNQSSENSGYITNVSVNTNFMGNGIATTLMNQCIEYAKQHNINEISLEVSNSNYQAFKIYTKFGFNKIVTGDNSKLMKLSLLKK